MDRLHLELFLPDADNPAERLQAEQAAGVAERLGVALHVEFAGGDFAVQVRQIYQATHREGQRPEAVLVMPVKEAALRSLSETTVAGGTGWAFLNRTAGNVLTLRQQHPNIPVFFVAPDQKEIGRIHVRQVRLLFPKGASILYVQGRVTTSSSEARHAGLVEAIERPGPRVEVVSCLDGNWSARDAEAAVARWMQLMVPAKLRVDAVVCQSDFMAAGALGALRKTSLALGDPRVSTVPVLGCDGMTSVGRKLVDEGTLAATVVVPTTADRAVELMVALRRYGQPVPEETILTPHSYPDDTVLLHRHRQTA